MQLGWVEELGSGVLNVSKYWQAYGKAAKPQFIEGATFKIVLPVSDSFFSNEDDDQHGNQYENYDAVSNAVTRQIDGGVNGGVNGGVSGGVNEGVNEGVSEGVNEGVNEGVRNEIIELVTILMNNEGLKAASYPPQDCFRSKI